VGSYDRWRETGTDLTPEKWRGQLSGCGKKRLSERPHCILMKAFAFTNCLCKKKGTILEENTPQSRGATFKRHRCKKRWLCSPEYRTRKNSRATDTATERGKGIRGILKPEAEGKS